MYKKKTTLIKEQGFNCIKDVNLHHLNINTHQLLTDMFALVIKIKAFFDLVKD